jgi:hypothetical protein
MNATDARRKLDMRIFGAMMALLLGGGSCMAQMSTMGTTQLGIPTTPGAIVSSPLGGPSPFVSLFSAATVPGAPATTLASPPLAQDPTIPGTSLSCTPTAFALSPSVMSVTSTTTGAAASPAAAMSAVGTSTASPLGTITTPTPNAAPMTSSTTQPVILPPAMPVLIVGAISGSATGTLAAAPPLGIAQPGSSCTAAPGNALTSAAALPLAVGDIPANPPPGAIQSPVADLGSTSIEPVMTVMPTPNSAACNESISMDLANPAMMAPANATGAAATPGVMPQGC